jgi:hypothetical protein
MRKSRISAGVENMHVGWGDGYNRNTLFALLYFFFSSKRCFLASEDHTLVINTCRFSLAHAIRRHGTAL